jgi:cell division septum initiation protein DivIVA
MCLKTPAVCNQTGCSNKTGLYNLKYCPHFDPRTETCDRIKEDAEVIKGDIPCLHCAKRLKSKRDREIEEAAAKEAAREARLDREISAAAARLRAKEAQAARDREAREQEEREKAAAREKESLRYRLGQRINRGGKPK